MEGPCCACLVSARDDAIVKHKKAPTLRRVAVAVCRPCYPRADNGLQQSRLRPLTHTLTKGASRCRTVLLHTTAIDTASILRRRTLGGPHVL